MSSPRGRERKSGDRELGNWIRNSPFNESDTIHIIIHVSHATTNYLNMGEAYILCDISSSPASAVLFAVLLNCYCLPHSLVVSSCINPQKVFPLLFVSILMKLSQNLGDFHHECEWNEFWVNVTFVCVCVASESVLVRGDYKGITFFNSYRFYVPFVLLIGGSVKWDDSKSGRRGRKEKKSLIVWWFGKLT